jgi:hypothetical protein
MENPFGSFILSNGNDALRPVIAGEELPGFGLFVSTVDCVRARARATITEMRRILIFIIRNFAKCNAIVSRRQQQSE